MGAESVDTMDLVNFASFARFLPRLVHRVRLPGPRDGG